MKAKKLAMLGLMSLSVAFLPSCGSSEWKSDAREIAVKCISGSTVYTENRMHTKGTDGLYYTTELRYIESGDSITIKQTRISWIASTYVISNEATETEFKRAGSSEGVWKYANTSWVIEYKEW